MEPDTALPDLGFLCRFLYDSPPIKQLLQGLAKVVGMLQKIISAGVKAALCSSEARNGSWP